MRSTRPLFYSAAAAAMLLIGTAPTHAVQTSQHATANCTTQQTSGDGVRHTCLSEPMTIRAPQGHVFIKDGPLGPKGGKTSGNGDEQSCLVEWGDWAEVLPGTGIVQPRSFTLRASAKGPSGHWAGRGWVGCTYAINMTPTK